MALPFTIQQFFDVFAAYNRAVWPMQWVLSIAAAGVVALGASAFRGKDRWIATLLALFWIWAALAYHVWHFARINPLAYAFAIAFMLEAGLLAWFGVAKGSVEFSFRLDRRGWIAASLVLYALIVYPAIGRAAGHQYPAAPTFGVPCPLTLFTIGVLFAARGNGARALLVIPVLWTLVGGSAAFLLDVHQDLALIPAGAAGLFVLARGPKADEPSR